MNECVLNTFVQTLQVIEVLTPMEVGFQYLRPVSRIGDELRMKWNFH
jgi:hypothetical protein